MKSKLTTFIFLVIVVYPLFSQQVSVTQLHEFDNTTFRKALINSFGDLVVIRSSGSPFFTIYDTTQYQTKAEISPSYYIHGDPIDEFYDLASHMDSGYLVCGRIPLNGSSVGTPVLYWFNDSAQVNALYKGEVWGTHNTGYYPVFKNVIMRSDSHIIALYQYTWISSADDSTQKSVLFEFDKALNLLGTDTIRNTHSLRMKYDLSQEKIILYGYKNTDVNPISRHSYMAVLDAFTFQTEFEKVVMEKLNITDCLLDNQVLVGSFWNYPSNRTKMVSYNINSGVTQDSITFKGDSTDYFITSINQRTNGNYVAFLQERANPIKAFGNFQLKMIILDSNLNVLNTTLLPDTTGGYVGSSFNVNDDFYFSYHQDIPGAFEGAVLLRADVSNITKVDEVLKEENWNVYPNPSTGIVTLNIPFLYQQESLSYQLYSITGVLTKAAFISSNKLKFPAIPNGLYILTISNNNQLLFTTKISKL